MVLLEFRSFRPSIDMLTRSWRWRLMESYWARVMIVGRPLFDELSRWKRWRIFWFRLALYSLGRLPLWELRWCLLFRVSAFSKGIRTLTQTGLVLSGDKEPECFSGQGSWGAEILRSMVLWATYFPRRSWLAGGLRSTLVSWDRLAGGLSVICG